MTPNEWAITLTGVLLVAALALSVRLLLRTMGESRCLHGDHAWEQVDTRKWADGSEFVVYACRRRRCTMGYTEQTKRADPQLMFGIGDHVRFYDDGHAEFKGTLSADYLAVDYGLIDSHPLFENRVIGFDSDGDVVYASDLWDGNIDSADVIRHGGVYG